MAKELLDFVLTDPVMFVRVEHRDQNIEMRKQVLQRNLLCDLHGVIGTLTPLRKFPVKRMMFRRDLIAERLEETAQEKLPTTAGQDGNPRTERQWNCYEFWAIFTVPRQCGVENPSYGDTHER